MLVDDKNDKMVTVNVLQRTTSSSVACLRRVPLPAAAALGSLPWGRLREGLWNDTSAYVRHSKGITKDCYLLAVSELIILLLF